MPENEIVHKLISGDEQAFRSFIDGNQDKVFRICMGFLHNKEDAEDVCQEVFIELYNSINSFKGDSALTTWVCRIAINRSLNILQKRKRQQLFEKLMLSFKREEQNKQTPAAILENKETSGIVLRAIGKLPQNQKIAYLLVKYDNMSYEEVAGIMNISLSSVESLIFRAKTNLKKQLLSYYEKNF